MSPSAAHQSTLARGVTTGGKHFEDFVPLVGGMPGEGTDGGGFVIGERAAQAGAGDDGLENVVGADAEFDDAGWGAELVAEAAKLVVEAADAGSDFLRVLRDEGDLLSIE